MTNIAHVWMIPGGSAWCREHGVGPGVERFLLKEHNLSLGNTGNDWAESLPPFDPDDTFKLIAAMHAFSPSRERWPETYERIEQEFNALLGRIYLYDCGDGDYLGCDEPWTRLDTDDLVSKEIYARRVLNWGRMIKCVADAHIDYPGLKPVITHPRAGFNDHDAYVPKVCDLFGSRVVYAFDAHVIQAAVASDALAWRGLLDIPADAEVWAYFALYPQDSEIYGDPYRASWMRHWTPTPCDKPHEIAAWAEERGISAILHNTSLKYLVDEAAGDPRLMLRPNARALLTGEDVR